MSWDLSRGERASINRSPVEGPGESAEKHGKRLPQKRQSFDLDCFGHRIGCEGGVRFPGLRGGGPTTHLSHIIKFYCTKRNIYSICEIGATDLPKIIHPVQGEQHEGGL
jgi:hypothetical protein